MAPVSDKVRQFFEGYERGANGLDPEFPAAHFGDSFLFGDPAGARAVKKDDFLKMLPRRTEYFKTLGLASSKILSLEETRLDDHYVMVKAIWQMRFEKDPGQPIVDENSATYVLYQQADSLRIVFQLDHQDLMQRAQALGLLP